MKLEKTQFNSEQEALAYGQSLFETAPLQQLVNQVNDRFEGLLRHAVTVRHEVREKIRKTDEEIEITIYGWIQKFLSKTKRTEQSDEIEINGKIGYLEFELYDQEVKVLYK